MPVYVVIQTSDAGSGAVVTSDNQLRAIITYCQLANITTEEIILKWATQQLLSDVFSVHKTDLFAVENKRFCDMTLLQLKHIYTQFFNFLDVKKVVECAILKHVLALSDESVL